MFVSGLILLSVSFCTVPCEFKVNIPNRGAVKHVCSLPGDVVGQPESQKGEEKEKESKIRNSKT